MRGIDMRKRKRNKPGRITAWLVTWEWIGNHAKRKDKIAAILNWRLSPERVAEIIEIIHANEFYTLAERLAIAKNKKLNPYQTGYGAIQGIPWEGRLLCGHNPFLEARLVDNLCVVKDNEGNQTLVWDEHEKPDLSWIQGNKSEEKH